MEVRAVANRALQTFANTAEKFGYTKREHIALMGFFKGVASGTITTGQSWPVKLLLMERAIRDAEPILANDLTNDECNVLEEIFSSGMCCEGSKLDAEKGGKFAERLSKPPKQR